MKRLLRPAAALPAVLVITLAGCEASKSSNPLSPTVAGPIAGVNITEPKLLEPTLHFKFKESQQPIKLLIENSSSNGVRPLTYAFEVAADAGFTNKVYARNGVPQGDGGRTSVIIERLELGRSYFWRARAEDGANMSTYASAAFEVLPSAFLGPPPQRSPLGGVTTTSRRPTFTVGRADRNAAVGYVRYEFRISTNPGSFVGAVGGAVFDDTGLDTSWVPPVDLPSNTVHYWRVAATDGETTSAWSPVESFRTPAAPAPGPGPGPSPGPAPSGPCNSSNPDTIVKCERNKYGHMNDGQIADFLRAAAASLNRNGIGGGPWGVLRKEGGHNCAGLSCDIVCAGSGTSQKQVDVLGDAEGAQIAGWGATKVWPDIRIDLCIIQ